MGEAGHLFHFTRSSRARTRRHVERRPWHPTGIPTPPLSAFAAPVDCASTREPHSSRVRLTIAFSCRASRVLFTETMPTLRGQHLAASERRTRTGRRRRFRRRCGAVGSRSDGISCWYLSPPGTVGRIDSLWALTQTHFPFQQGPETRQSLREKGGAA